jgi:acyl carrier protein
MKGTLEIIKSFVQGTFPTGTKENCIEEDMSFLESGLIDSMGVLELVDFLEGQFGIAVEDSELVPENLDSIRNICRYLESKGISATGT